MNTSQLLKDSQEFFHNEFPLLSNDDVYDLINLLYPEKKDFYAIDGKNGGFICHGCYTNEELIPSNFPKIVDRFINVDIKTIKEIKLKDSDKKIINTFLKEYYEKYSAVYINSLKFLSEIE